MRSLPLPCRGIYLQPLPMFWYCVCKIRSHPKNKQLKFLLLKFSKLKLAVAERYLIKIHVKNKEWNKQSFRICLPVKLGDGRIPIKKGKVFSYLIYSSVSLSKMARKNRTFFMKVSGIWNWSQTFKKFSYWKNLLLLWMMLNNASAHL